MTVETLQQLSITAIPTYHELTQLRKLKSVRMLKSTLTGVRNCRGVHLSCLLRCQTLSHR